MNRLKTKQTFFFLSIVFVTGFIVAGCQDKGLKRGGMMRNNPYKVTSDDLLSIKAVNDKQVWTVGSFGNIFHTSDGGKTWEKQKSKVEEQLCEVDFVDELNGWVVGSYGLILHTADGGKNWTRQQSPVDRLFIKVDFYDENHGWAVGEQGTIVRTVDGGKTWEDHSIKYGPVFNGVSFADSSSGWIVGDYGTILHTIDGGITWQEQKCQDIVPVIKPDEWEQPLPMLYDVCFVDNNRGWIGGVDGIILHTDDGGKNWQKLRTNSKGKIYSIEIKGNRGLAVGDKGIYISSSDGGLTWTVSIEAIKTRKWLRDQSLAGDQGAWIVGSTGTLIRSTDGGKSWEMLSGRAYELPVRKKMLTQNKS